MTERPSSSTSSTGHVDGLGRRSLAFDRTTGAILERLYVRPELAVFEQVLQRRVAHLATLEDERFARPSAVERDRSSGEVIVVAEFIAGSRLSELLETAADAALVPGVDVALGYLLETLPALSVLHTVHRVTHGLIDPTRTMLTAEGQVVFLDVAFGTPIERLALGPARLWNQFGIAALPGTTGPVRFDAAADLAQVALSALMLIVGRNIRAHEFPDALPSLLHEVIDVAQIRGSAAFATGLERFFQRALPIPARRAYATADEAMADVRHLVLREIGVDACRKAVVDFVENMEAAFSTGADTRDDDTTDDLPASPAVASPVAARSARVTAVEEVADAEPETSPARHVAPHEPPAHDSDDDSEELELSLDNLDGEAEPEKVTAPAEQEIYDLSALDSEDYETAAASLITPRETPRNEPAVASALESVEARQVAEPEPQPEAQREAISEPEPEIFAAPVPVERDEADLASAVQSVPIVDDGPTFGPVAIVEPPVASEDGEEIDAAGDALAVESEVANASEPPVEPERESASSRRKKRQQQRSARARKDKLRSTAAGQKAAPPPEPPSNRPSSPTGWLVSPQRSTAFETPAQPQAAAPQRAALPAVPSFTPSPVGHLPQPVYSAPAGATPAYGTPMAPMQPPVPSPLTRTPASTSTTASSAAKVKPKPQPPEPSPVQVQTPIERFGTMAPLTLGQSPENDQPREFPWKLAAVAVLVALFAVVVGRAYLPGRQAESGEPGAQAVATPPAAPVQPPAAEETPDAAIPDGRGRLIVTTQPAGIKVLIDRKPAGETPLKIDVPAGRRTLTFVTSGGEVNRGIRVIAGKAMTLDVPVFSGWLSIVAPFVLDVAENGTSLGTTEQSRLTLPPGKHQLTVANKDLGYSAVQEVEIEAGSVKSLTVDPRGSVSLNAVPWAEIWMDGQKLGDTPLVTQVSLGSHEFLFKHPQHGERRLTATVRANAATPLSIDFTK